MFKLFTRAAWLGCCIGVVMSGADARAAATMSLKAVKKNGVVIATGPTNTIDVVPGDTITAEVKFFGWGHPPFDAAGANTGLVKTYQVQLEGTTGVQSSGPTHGLVMPIGWDAPLVHDIPPCDDPLYPVAHQQFGCIGTTFNENLMASFDESRTDSVLFGLQPFYAVSNAFLDIAWGGTAFAEGGQFDSKCVGGTNVGGGCASNEDCPGSNCQPFVYYGGTLNLRALPERPAGLACVGGSTPGVSCTSDAACRVCVAGSNPGTQCTSSAQCTGGGTCPAGGTCVAYPARPAACGDFTFDLVNAIGATFICNPLTPQECTVPGVLQPLVIHLPTCPVTGGACCETTGVCADDVLEVNCQAAGQRWGGIGSTCDTLNPRCIPPPPPVIVSSDPPHCAIDARIPFVAGQPTQRRGFQSIALTFDLPAGATEDGAGDYTIQTFGTGQCVTPTISNVVLNGNVATVNFVAPICSKKWICVLHNASNTRSCIAGLPADANGDRTAAPVDILDIIDNLNGVRNPALAVYQCDIDRSALCAPADILQEIDLLNGASGFPVANGTTLDACPSSTGP